MLHRIHGRSRPRSRVRLVIALAVSVFGMAGTVTTFASPANAEPKNCVQDPTDPRPHCYGDGSTPHGGSYRTFLTDSDIEYMNSVGMIVYPYSRSEWEYQRDFQDAAMTYWDIHAPLDAWCTGSCKWDFDYDTVEGAVVVRVRPR